MYSFLWLFAGLSPVCPSMPYKSCMEELRTQYSTQSFITADHKRRITCLHLLAIVLQMLFLLQAFICLNANAWICLRWQLMVTAELLICSLRFPLPMPFVSPVYCSVTRLLINSPVFPGLKFSTGQLSWAHYVKPICYKANTDGFLLEEPLLWARKICRDQQLYSCPYKWASLF